MFASPSSCILAVPLTNFMASPDSRKVEEITLLWRRSVCYSCLNTRSLAYPWVVKNCQLSHCFSGSSMVFISPEAEGLSFLCREIDLRDEPQDLEEFWERPYNEELLLLSSAELLLCGRESLPKDFALLMADFSSLKGFFMRHTTISFWSGISKS